ncbi:MAG: amidohydrolase family protein [Parvularculaceae bacterium]|nr:amidohydrolase family protein [Parvularculaceae bacterium]
MQIFDSHQHFWQLNNPFTDWPTADLRAIYRDYTPERLRLILDANRISETILVQAAPSVAETEYCFALAKRADFVKGVVGWIDFESGDALKQLDRLAANPALRGLRPMVQSISEPGWLLKDEFAPVFGAMVDYGLTFDGLVLANQLNDLAALAKLYPKLNIVLDHAGKPLIASGDFETWERAVSRLAAAPNVWCKLSGLWTEAGKDISANAMRPWVAHLLASFGTGRLMWGSDWPVINLVGGYKGWLDQCFDLMSGLKPTELEDIFWNNGRHFYGVA